MSTSAGKAAANLTNPGLSPRWVLWDAHVASMPCTAALSVIRRVGMPTNATARKIVATAHASAAIADWSIPVSWPLHWHRDAPRSNPFPVSFALRSSVGGNQNSFIFTRGSPDYLRTFLSHFLVDDARLHLSRWNGPHK